MPNLRIYELAKNLGRANKDLLTALEEMGITGKTHSSAIDSDLASRLKARFGKKPEPKPTAKKEVKKPEPKKAEPRKPEERPEPKKAEPAPVAEATPAPTPQVQAEKPKEQAQEAKPVQPAPKPPVAPSAPPVPEKPRTVPLERLQRSRPAHGYDRPRPPFQQGGQRPPRPGEQGAKPYDRPRPPFPPGGQRPPFPQGGQRPPRPGEQGARPYDRPRPPFPGGQRPPYQPGGQRPPYAPGGQRPSRPGEQGARPYDKTRPPGGPGQRPFDRTRQQKPAAPIARAEIPIERRPDLKKKKDFKDKDKQAQPKLKQYQRQAMKAEIRTDEIDIDLIEKFRDEYDHEKAERLTERPGIGLQRAFQSIRKIETRKFPDSRGGKKRGGKRPFTEERHEQKAFTSTAPRRKTLKIEEGITVKEFAELIGVKATDVIKEFMKLGVMATINHPVDMDAAFLVSEQFGVKLEAATTEDALEVADIVDDKAHLIHKPPVVTIMGHVDHGKTSLLDAIRKTKVTETEFGGITQHIGAYKVSKKGKEIVFLDTPGHEAFTTLRARGAKVTDIVILVVAADDGVKPQTIEAIDHAKAAGVPIIVAINKIDKEGANPDKARAELAEHGIMPEDWGGQNIFVHVSAKKLTGIDDLLDMILLQADVLELKANPDRLAKGVIIESKLDKGRGPVATVLVQAGTLKVGDVFLSGVQFGKVRALIDDTGKRVQLAGPATPVEVIGFDGVPNSGDTFITLDDEKKARQIALARVDKQRSLQMHRTKKLTLDELYSKIKEGKVKELNIVLKADAQGSIEALKSSLEGITHPEVKVRIIHNAIGGINESDVMLAAASEAIILGFNVRPDSKASQTAEREGVDLRLYNIIYVAIDDVKKALEGMLAPTFKEKILGKAEVRQTFQSSKIGTIAGCYVIEGAITRVSDGIRIIRNNIVVFEGKLSTLKRFKDDVREVQTGYECGIAVENYNDIKVGDIIENFALEKIETKL